MTQKKKNNLWLAQWRKDNPDKAKAISVRYQIKNREAINERNRLRRLKNPKAFNRYQRKWRKDNPDKVAVYRQRDSQKRAATSAANSATN